MPVFLFGLLSACILFGSETIATNSIANCSGAFLHDKGGIVTVSKFDLGDGQSHFVFVDFRTGYIRILKEESGEFIAGATLLSDSPVELKAHCKGDQIQWQIADASPDHARQIGIREENIKFRGDNIDLAGTIYLPEGPPPYPAVVLLHGSGPLTRYSFGPIQHFFAASGVAVFAYDKRGTGQSEGNLETSTFDQLAEDGAAAISYLRSRKEIDGERIGLWGSSQGGFLAAAVAAKTKGLRFLINHSGMYVPVWQQEIYRTKAEMEAEGYSQKEIATALRYLQKFFQVARTGKQWDELQKQTAELNDKPWFELVTQADTLKKLRWYWETLYSYDPAKPLEQVNCPVLGVFGGLDKSTPVFETISNMTQALKKSGNSHFEYQIFPRADHGLLEAKTGSEKEIPNLTRLVSEAFEFESRWILAQNYHEGTKTKSDTEH